MKNAIALAVLLGVLSSACGGKTPTQPSSPGLTSTLEHATGNLPVEGSVPYSFAVTQTGTVYITLASLTDSTGAVSPAVVALALGTPSGTTCTPTTTMNTTAALKAQITSPVNAGTYCVGISDIGNLTDAVNFVIRVVQNPTTSSTATATETFTSNVTVGGSASRTFQASQAGNVSITLQSLSPSSVAGLAIGIPGLTGAGCSLNTAVKTEPGSTAQITAAVDPGSYCVRIFDVGNFTGVATSTRSFTISIVHP